MGVIVRSLQRAENHLNIQYEVNNAWPDGIPCGVQYVNRLMKMLNDK
jgi:hypothetical protein